MTPPEDGTRTHLIVGMSKIVIRLPEGLLVLATEREGGVWRITGERPLETSLIAMVHRQGEAIMIVMEDLVEGEGSMMIMVEDAREVMTLAVDEGTIMAVEGEGMTMDVVEEMTITGGGKEAMITVVVVVEDGQGTREGGREMMITVAEEEREMTTAVEGDGTTTVVGGGGKTIIEVVGGGRGMTTIPRVVGEEITMIAGEEIMAAVAAEGITRTVVEDRRGREKGAGGGLYLIVKETLLNGGVRGTEVETETGMPEDPHLPRVGRMIKASKGGMLIAGVGMIMGEVGGSGNENGRGPWEVGRGGSRLLVLRLLRKRWMRRGLNW